MIKVKSKIYIFCPSYYKTGGTECLHSIANDLNKMFGNVEMFYIDSVGAAYKHFKKNKNLNRRHPEFDKYNFKETRKIVDTADNIIIAPEIYTFELLKYKKCTRIVWWLSVDFYVRPKLSFEQKFKSYIGLYRKPSLKLLKQVSDFNITQSYYAHTFLKDNGIDSFIVSDYLNEQYFNQTYEISRKEDFVAYNPFKGLAYTKQLIAKSDLKFVPIINMTNGEVIDLLKRAKVYIDFGNHPGKDRIPREAAMLGCCVITNKKGSAFHFEDVSIQEEFKFDDNKDSFEQVLLKIDTCFKGFVNEHDKFNDYRTLIKGEYARSQAQLKSIFSI